MERGFVLTACALRQPCTFYSTFGSSTLDLQQVRFTSTRGNLNSKNLDSPKPKASKDPIAQSLQRKNVRDVKPLPHQSQDKQSRSRIMGSEYRAGTPSMSRAGSVPVQSPSMPSALRPPASTTQGHEAQIHPNIPEYVIYPGDTQLMPLPDGRFLGYAIMGYRNRNTKRPPLVVHHGTPGTRLEYHFLQKWAESRGISIIAPERPGCGVSTYRKDYTVLDHAMDVQHLVKHYLGYQRYRILGVSGGGPYALAGAMIASSTEVLATGIMCGVAPPEANRHGQSFARALWTLKLLYAPMWLSERTFRKEFANYLKYVLKGQPPTSDTLEGRKAFALRENYMRDGVKGYLNDFRVTDSYWGFDLKDLVHTNPVLMYTGTMDTATPISGARYMASQIPNAELREKANADHKSVQDYMWELLDRMHKL